MSRYLDEILQRLKALAGSSTIEIHRDWVRAVLADLRKHLEISNQKNEYPILNFYCNWSLHTDLNKGIVQDMLEKISRIITDDTTGHPADRISEILSLTLLRKEIRMVLKNDAGIECGLFELYDNWKSFTELLFPIILEQPLKRTREHKTHHWVESLELYDNNSQVFWRIKVEPGNSDFIGPLLRTDHESPQV